MYRLLSGLIAHASKKEEFSVLIMGLDNAGKTTFLEKIKSLFNETPDVDPASIAPTIGQNSASSLLFKKHRYAPNPSAYFVELDTAFRNLLAVGRITLSSSVLQFWDLGGQRDIRSLWPKYYSECHAVCFVIDSTDQDRIEECWNVFETIVSDRRVDGVPTLVLANKQDAQGAMQVEDIKQMFNKLIVGKLNVSEGAVMPISALRGDGIREAVQWLFVRVQNSRQMASSKTRS